MNISHCRGTLISISFDQFPPLFLQNHHDHSFSRGASQGIEIWNYNWKTCSDLLCLGRSLEDIIVDDGVNMKMCIFNIRVYLSLSQSKICIHTYLSLHFYIHLNDPYIIVHVSLCYCKCVIVHVFVAPIFTDCVCYLLTNAPLCNILLSILPLHTLTYLFLVLPSKYARDASAT